MESQGLSQLLVMFLLWLLARGETNATLRDGEAPGGEGADGEGAEQEPLGGGPGVYRVTLVRRPLLPFLLKETKVDEEVYGLTRESAVRDAIDKRKGEGFDRAIMSELIKPMI